MFMAMCKTAESSDNEPGSGADACVEPRRLLDCRTLSDSIVGLLDTVEQLPNTTVGQTVGLCQMTVGLSDL